MDTEIDWQSELDRSFGDGEDLDVGRYVASGRRAVRRRRVAAVVVAATVAVGGSAAWAASPGAAPRSDAPVATTGPAPERASDSDGGPTPAERKRELEKLRELANAAADREADFGSSPAVLTADGLALAPNAGPILQRVPNPMGYTAAQGTSIAIRVMFKGREHYALIARFGDDSSSSMYNTATGDFEGWLAGQVQSQATLDSANGVIPSSGSADPRGWLRLTEDGEVESTRSDIVIVETRVDVDLGEGFAQDSDRAGAVRLIVDGESRVAAWRVVDGTLEVISGPGRFDSLTAFIGWARQQYASGQGMR